MSRAKETHAAAIFVLLCVPTIATGEGAAEHRHQLFINSLKKTAADISDRALVGVDTLEDWKTIRPRLRQEFLYTMGLDPLPERSPLNVEVTGLLTRPHYRIEKIVFQSMPGLYVTGNLYAPYGAERTSPDRPLPTILYVCGHSPHPKGAKWSYQDRAVWFAENGYVCFVLDTLEFAEVAGIHHGLHDLNMWHWLSRGYTPAGVEVWNAIRAIDYLETRKEVDSSRIGITGISGGGAVSWYAAAADERIAVAVPVCGTFTFGSQAKHWRASGQCDCIYYHNTFLTDLSIVAALIAPRPLLICSGQLDDDFPPDGYHEVFQRGKRIYDLYAGVDVDSGTSRIKEVDESVGHTDSPLFRRETRQWTNRWLRDESDPLKIVPNPTEKPSSPDDLACLTRLPKNAINYRIDELFIPTANPVPPETRPQWVTRRKEIISELKDKSFRWFPKSRLPLEPRVGGNRGGWASRYADYQDVEIQTEPGVTIRVQFLRTKNRSSETPLLIYAKRRGDSIYFLDLDELLPVLGRYDVAILNPRMTEHSISEAEYADIERTAAWTGRTVAAMQVWDVLRTVQWLHEEKKLAPGSLSIYGKGDMGIVSLYAAILDERISQVILRDPTETHRRGPALLNVLRTTDIPEAAAALAPRKLVFLGDEVPAPFQLTTTIYELHNAAKQIKACGSLPEALEVWKY